VKTCKTCLFWMAKDRTRCNLRICACPKITGDYLYASDHDDVLTYQYDEGGDFFTGPDFGCVHHADKT
jgi:hypothetical protein